MYASDGSTRYSPRLVFPSQPETLSSLFVPSCPLLLPRQYSVIEEVEEQQRHCWFGPKQSSIANDQKHSSWCCYADIGFQQTPTSSNENAVSRSHEVVGELCAHRNAVPSKSRIKWTQHLHDKFIDCVGRLGGADKATPKGILRLMDVEGLTIYHIKSHLQKHRFNSDSKKGRSLNSNTQLIDIEIGKQLVESFQMQLDMQLRLHKQLQIQNNLQLKIEEQGKQLKLLLEQHLKQPTKDDTPTRVF